MAHCDEVSKTIQKQNVDLSVVISMLQSLQLFPTKQICDEFRGFESKAKDIAKEANYADTALSASESTNTAFESLALRALHLLLC